jgi:hypothetical protein
MAKMNPEAKALWLKALRSGEYEQGHSKLCKLPDGPEGKGYFCCLGVLADVAVKSGAVELRVERRERDVRYGNDEDYLPPEVMKWAGLPNNNPSVKYDYGHEACKAWCDEPHEGFDQLATLNDDYYHQWSFTPIADAIEANF